MGKLEELREKGTKLLAYGDTAYHYVLWAFPSNCFFVVELCKTTGEIQISGCRLSGALKCFREATQVSWVDTEAVERLLFRRFTNE